MTNSHNDDPVTLSISCVYYDSDLSTLKDTIDSLLVSVNYAKLAQVITSAELHLINNNVEKDIEFLNFSEKYKDIFDKVITYIGYGNIGYGRGNNLAIQRITSKYHLILNPDVFQQKDALFLGISHLERYPNIGMLAPSAKNEKGNIDFLAKRQPTLLVLMLRALNIPFLSNIFKNQLDWYTYKDKIVNESDFNIELASGCFMLIRTNILKQVKGFSEKYFLYFEDFDLSRKLSKYGEIIFYSKMKIIHLGGNTTAKGRKHIIFFLKSLILFYTTQHHSKDIG